MKLFHGSLLILVAAISCRQQTANTDQLKVTGDLQHVADQSVYLEQLSFSQKAPEVLDSARIVNGKFTLSGPAKEEGLYRLRLEKAQNGFIFINDKPEINFKADMDNVSLDGPQFKTPVNEALREFIKTIEGKQQVLRPMLDPSLPDSLKQSTANERDRLIADYKKFITTYIDTIKDPVLAMFAIGYTRDIDPQELSRIVPGMVKRFPGHQGIAGIVGQYNDYIKKLQEPAKPTGAAIVGSMAPDFTLNDVDGKPFTLSSLRGKYVLVDFWASWCGPCRGENPNVVNAYNTFKDKNFTVLGVSLDEDKGKWIKAIQADQLTWKHVSDLKQWNSAVVPLYGFEGIPYNVLVDPQGKIIATELRGTDLLNKLAEVLK